MSATGGVSHLKRLEEGSEMNAVAVGVEARCPLCGVSILSVGRGGRVLSEDLHPVPLYRRGRFGEGFMLCDECGMLADLPRDVTLN
jgi:hypothetical protein